MFSKTKNLIKKWNFYLSHFWYKQLIFGNFIFKSKKFKIAILSNGTPDLLKGLVESNKIENYFDDIMSIETVGIYKPDVKVYEMPIKKYGCKPENICFLS